MDFSPRESQAAVAQLARQIFTARCTPAALKQNDAAGQTGFHEGLWQDLAKAGLLATSIPEMHGGSGHGFLELCSLLEQAGAAVAPVPLWATLVLGVLPI